MSKLVALMYHAIYANDAELHAIDEEDRPYAVSATQFEKHLALLEQHGIPIHDPDVVKQNNLPNSGVILTFDDGHKSFYDHAFRILKGKGYKAVFFITSDLAANRDDFCSWQELKEMADAGMAIQSHGQTHLFFNDMTATEAKSEFKTAKITLENETQQTVDTISFPGGRYTDRDINIGKAEGYNTFYTSEIGTIKPEQIGCVSVLPRLAIRQNDSEATFLLMAKADTLYLKKEALKNSLKRFAKLILGNRFYHYIYTLRSRN